MSAPEKIWSDLADTEDPAYGLCHASFALKEPDETLYVREDLCRELVVELKKARQYVFKWTTYQGSASQWEAPGGELYDLYIAPMDAKIAKAEALLKEANE